MTDVTLVTCAEYPRLDPDDQLLLAALKKLNLKVDIAIWSDSDFDWEASKLSLIRSTWDYDLHPQEFVSWVQKASRATRLYNDPALIEWNIDKRYLQKLSEKGIKIIPTRWLEIDEQFLVEDLVAQFGQNIVIKPTVGLGGSGVLRVDLNEQKKSSALSKIRHAQKAGTVMLQPFVQSVIDEGERSLMFFGGKFSHAVRKSPFAQMALAGLAGERAITATTEEIVFGEFVIAQLGALSLYARVDVIWFENQLHLMELELIEPSLYFSYGDNAAHELAALIAMKLS